MSWWSTAWDWTKEAVSTAFENDAVKDIAATAIGLAGSYAINEFMSDTPEPATAQIDVAKDTILTADGSDGSDADMTQKAKEDARRRVGRSATILTGPQGLINDDDLEIKRHTLLGG